VEALVGSGLQPDEAFLVAVKRMGNLDEVSREFAREHSERLWKQLVVAPGEGESEKKASARREFLVVIGLALAAAVAIKVPALFGWELGDESAASFYARNITFFVLPFLAGFFVWKRRSGTTGLAFIGASFIAAVVFANVYPLVEEGHTMVLTVLHLPIALWLVVGLAYVGGTWWRNNRRMDFVRFTGELFIYFVLIALGGGVLTAFTFAIFESIGIDVENFASQWLVPCGAAGAVIVAAWLVEAKQSVIENMAPVLTRVFTPLFALLLVVFLVTMVWTGKAIDVEREMLIFFDLLLVLVLGLLLYSLSARDPQAPPGIFDTLQLVLVVAALVVDVMALVAIAGRISEFGFSPNKVAALGENVILLVNLSWSAVLYFRFIRGQGSFRALERWQVAYLPVYAIWAAIVVVLFPLVFGWG
jgi:hypothetical protein